MLGTGARTRMMEPANDSVNADARPTACCGTCARWYERTYSGRQYPSLGCCDVRPGRVDVYTTAQHGCDVAHGRAWTPIVELA